MRWVSPVPVSSYGKLAASVTSAEGPVATLAERERGTVADPESPERTRTTAAITFPTRGLTKPEAARPPGPIGGLL